jgi:hypothetical protein
MVLKDDVGSPITHVGDMKKRFRRSSARLVSAARVFRTRRRIARQQSHEMDVSIP